MFTQEQINEIREKLALSGSKDKSLPLASLPLSGKEILALVQDGKNKSVPIEEFFEEFAQYIDGSERVDFFNVSRYAQRLAGAAASVSLTLSEAVALCPNDVRRGGQVITFIDHEGDWAIWQYTATTANDWTSVDVYWKNLNDNPNLGIELTSSIDTLEVGTTADMSIHFNTIDGGAAETVELFVNDTLVQTYHNIAEFDYNRTINSTTKFKVRAVQYGTAYEKEINIIVSYPAWVGAGTDDNQVMTDDNQILISESINNAFDVTFSATGNLIIILPASFTLNPVTMNGFEVPMQASSVMVINRVNYKSYKSANQYIEGTHRFVIGTYTGNERELITSLQQDVAGLQTLVGQQGETNNEQERNLGQLGERVDELEAGTYNTSDEEDITLVNNKYKFADKAYSATNFSGKGRVYLRKNIRRVEEEIDENTTIVRTINLLTSAMMAITNSIYIVQYDYTLRNGRITLPDGCVLQYAGGTFNDGILDVTKAVLLPGWENIIGTNLTITGVPAAGAWYFNPDAGKIVISDGTNWVDLEGNIIS